MGDGKRLCKKHGVTDFAKRGDGYYRCRACAVDSVRKRRKKLKRLAVEYKGGKCERCSYNKSIEALDFHHLDPAEKEFGLSNKGLTRSWEKTKMELDKCVLLCANCHRLLHWAIKQAEVNEKNAKSAA